MWAEQREPALSDFWALVVRAHTWEAHYKCPPLSTPGHQVEVQVQPSAPSLETEGKCPVMSLCGMTLNVFYAVI